jgi:hypothetical protein
MTNIVALFVTVCNFCSFGERFAFDKNEKLIRRKKFVRNRYFFCQIMRVGSSANE